MLFRGKMKSPWGDSSRGAAPWGAVDPAAINETIQNALQAAGLDTRSGPLREATETIERTLSSVGLSSRVDPQAPTTPRERPTGREASGTRNSPQRYGSTDASGLDASVAHSFSNAAGTRSYALHVPAACATASVAVPLVLMLHGCTQSAQDFAEGTRMNALADQHGFIVAYPMQSPRANPNKCWNWFRADDQHRDRGEPSILAGIALEVASKYPVDRQRIFVAGLSAGGAMAVVLGDAYPELFAAVGVHSGLPYGAAHDLPSAMKSMQSGTVAARPSRSHPGTRVPTIVFHGDRDTTVNVGNGRAIVQDALGERSRFEEGASQEGRTAGGRRYTRTVYPAADGAAEVEHWLLHGAGHAWSGGSASGSYTDRNGPDASAEMVRFFYAQRR